MKIALGVTLDENAIRFARQLGVRHVVWTLGSEQYPGDRVDYEVFARARETFDKGGLELLVLEGFPHHFYDKAMFNLPGRDDEIAGVCESIRNMGRAGIGVLSYQWMPLGGLSTDVVRGRGGARERRFDLDSALDHPAAVLDWREQGLYQLPDRDMGREEVWENLTYFLERVVPAAEEAGVKLAMHPDDPPVESFLGVERILYDLDGLQRLIDTMPSPNNGLNFCQGCVSEMAGVDVVQAIRRFGSQGAIHFAHFRDTRGTVPRFDEVFMDEGDTDMVAAMRAYVDAGVDVCIRADHTPGIVGDNERAERGYGFQIGYMKGLLAAAERARSGGKT